MRERLQQNQIAEKPATAAERLIRELPRDQALGLRLIALARAAAAVHMSEMAAGTAGFGDRAPLNGSQARGLLSGKAVR